MVSLLMFENRSSIRKREAKWMKDEDNELYFAWHHQGLVDAALYEESGVRQPFKEFWEKIHENFNEKTSGEGRSVSSIMNRWHILVMRSNA